MTMAEERFEYYASKTNPQINHPDYYKANGYEAIDYIEAHGLNFNLGNVIKYVTRAGRKDNDVEVDLAKAAWYLNRERTRQARKNAPNAPEDYLVSSSVLETTE